uniref:Uncharacterized protein n=1 Tax=Nonomuraea gerenzanensis TaxID=93944 RepID=A0A1M4EF00_9ACTN|nr:hypothetical protein BN4615_P6764 [Nonomuraea gerenzanensis]
MCPFHIRACRTRLRGVREAAAVQRCGESAQGAQISSITRKKSPIAAPSAARRVKVQVKRAADNAVAVHSP